MKKYAVLHFLTLAICVLFIRCSKDENYPYDGTWNASTSHILINSFQLKISENSIKEISIYHPNLSGFCSQAPDFTIINGSYPIQGNSFTIPGDYGISGVFSTPDNASGSFIFEFNDFIGCSSGTVDGTWTAFK